MRFYSHEECHSWLLGRKRTKPQVEAEHVYRVHFPREEYRLYFLAHWVASSCMEREPCLLWITEWGVWPSSENWHLYYKLRQSYGNFELLDEMSGHYFLPHETEDLASFLHLAMLNGWGGYVLTHLNRVNAFFSHDEFIDFYAHEERFLDDARTQFPDSHT